MSASRNACEICSSTGKGIYTCPRCSRRYCSSACYRDPKHELCSESFYREWVETSLHDSTFETAEKNKMIEILKKHNSNKTGDEEEEEDDDDLNISDRFAGLNIDDLDEEALWQNLSEKERNEFKTLIEDNKNLESIISIKQPWWTLTIINLVTDLSDEMPEKNDDVSIRPLYPLNVQKLSSLSSKKPSECIKFNMVNILYSYAFLFRFYNCDVRDFLEDVVKYLFEFSPVLSEGKNYSSLEETIQDSVRLIMKSDLGAPLDFVKSIVNDVSSILQGPRNTRPSYFVLCALNDIELICFEQKNMMKGADKTEKKKLSATIKKIDYFMSWCLDFEDEFSELSSELVLLMLPDLFTEPFDIEKSDENSQEIIKRKPIIEEID